MDKHKATLMWASLARDYPQLKDWFQQELEAQYEILAANPDEHVLRQAQGHAQRLKSLLKLLAESPRHVGR